MPNIKLAKLRRCVREVVKKKTDILQVSQKVKQRVNKLFLTKICFSLRIIINKSQMHPSEENTNELTVRGGPVLESSNHGNHGWGHTAV